MLPVISTVIAAILMMFSSLFVKSNKTIITLATLFLAIILAVSVYTFFQIPSGEVVRFFNGHFELSRLSLKINILLLSATLFYFLLFGKHKAQVGFHTAEYYSLIFFILVGVQLIAGFGSLLMLFLAIEIISIPQYVLAGSNKQHIKSSEAALKYFLMGSFSTGIFLMGIALLFGGTGTFDVNSFDFTSISEYNVLAIIGILLIAVSFGFKVSAAPMHFWTPDVYDGAPTQFTAFMATIAKGSVFIGFIRLFMNSFGEMHSYWLIFLSIITLLTLIVGNITAVYQQSVKRMLAYSSIAQAGFMLFSVLAINSSSIDAIIIYIFSYSVATLILFSVVAKMKDYTFDGFAGFAKREPFVAFVMVICLASLAGIPLTAGFFAKFYVLKAFIIAQPQMVWLVIVALILAAVAVYYYFKLIRSIYFKKEVETISYEPFSTTDRFLFALGAASLILVGIVPDILL